MSLWIAKQWLPFLSFHFFAMVRRWDIILNKTEFRSWRYDSFVVTKTTHNWANNHIHRNICFYKPLHFCVCVYNLDGKADQLRMWNQLLFKYSGFKATTVVETFWMRSKSVFQILRDQTNNFFANILRCKAINLFKHFYM